MGSAIGGSLVMAVGISITPLAMAAIVVLLSTPRARTNGVTYLVGWVLGLLILGAIALAIIGSARPGTTSTPASWVSWLRIVLGVLLLIVGTSELVSDPSSGHARALPAWVGKADNIKPPMAFGLGFVLAGIRPKNLLLAVAGAAAIASAGLSGQQESVAYLVFIAVATVGVAIPVIVYVVMGDRGPEMTRALGEWLTRNTAAIMSVVCIVIGVDLIGRGIAGLTS